MNWWKRWKAKHWEKRRIDDPPGKEFGIGWYEHVPKFREWCERVWADVVEHRWVALSIAGAIIAALLSNW